MAVTTTIDYPLPGWPLACPFPVGGTYTVARDLLPKKEDAYTIKVVCSLLDSGNNPIGDPVTDGPHPNSPGTGNWSVTLSVAAGASYPGAHIRSQLYVGDNANGDPCTITLDVSCPAAGGGGIVQVDPPPPPPPPGP